MALIDEKLALSVAELAESLGICKPSAYDLVKSQGFPSIQISANRFIVPVDGLRIWLADKGGYLETFLRGFNNDNEQKESRCSQWDDYSDRASATGQGNDRKCCSN